MAVQDNGTRIQYTATASQTVFPYPFEILDEDDITVVQNSTTLSKTTHYTVSGVGSDTGGNITFVTGATSGDVITIYRSMALSRVTNYQANAAFLESEVDADFDRLWMAMQQNESDATRGIRASQTDSILNSTNTELAIPATRAGKVLGFDSTGALSYYASTVASADFIQVTTTAAMAALASPTVGDVVQTAEFSTGSGGGGTYECVTVGTTANVDLPNGFNIIVSTVDATKCFVLRVGEVANVRQFGANGDGVSDQTGAIRAALSVLDAAGGGVLYIPVGIYPLASSDTPAWCLRIPANVKIQGESRDGSVLTRLNLEEASILLVNDDADTATGYSAAGNITIENLTIRDSLTAERTQGVGDLIAFGHGNKLIVQNCNFGKHTQHCLDIGGSKNILFSGNFQDNNNGLTGYAENSAVQVDSANGSAFVGINVDNTESEDVTITDNRFINTNSNSLLHIGHNSGTAKNVIIANNYLKGTSRSFARLIKNDTDGASIDGLIIADNIIDITTANNAGISILTNGNSSEFIKNVTISGNVIKGTGRFGIVVGGTDSYLGSTYPNVENITVEGNTIDIDHTDSTVNNGGIVLNLIRACKVENNMVRVKKDTDASVEFYGIDVVSALLTTVSDNTVTTELTTYTGTADSACIRVAKFGSVATTSDVGVSVISNNLDATQLKYCLFNEGVDINDSVLFSANRFNGALNDPTGGAHIFETIPCSDGTNGYKQIDLGSGSYSLAIAIDTNYPVSTGLIKKSSNGFIRSAESIDVTYTSSGVGSLATATEDLLNSSTTIGLQVKNRNPSAGTFDIATGQTGINTTIQPGGAPSTRTAGSISVQAGI